MVPDQHVAPYRTAEDRQVDQQLREVESRLLTRYGGDDSAAQERAREVVASVTARFADSKIRTYLPVLVERAAKAELDPT
ncbi:MAG TPA: hypothetical protein VGH89_12635 [Pseudonocardia sp.]|jgi:hypothetical protein